MLVILLGGGTALTFFLSNATCGRSLTQLVESYENDLLERTSDDMLHLFNQGDLCGQVLVGMLQRINDPTLLNETARTRQSLVGAGRQCIGWDALRWPGVLRDSCIKMLLTVEGLASG
jgi:hypothetical protein